MEGGGEAGLVLVGVVLLLAVCELRHAAVAVGAARRVEAVPGEQLVLGLEQLPLLLALLLLGALSLAPGDLLGVHGLPAARGGVGVVGRPPRTLLGVLLLPPFGASVLEPHLRAHARTHTGTHRDREAHTC